MFLKDHCQSTTNIIKLLSVLFSCYVVRSALYYRVPTFRLTEFPDFSSVFPIFQYFYQQISIDFSSSLKNHMSLFYYLYLFYFIFFHKLRRGNPLLMAMILKCANIRTGMLCRTRLKILSGHIAERHSYIFF